MLGTPYKAPSMSSARSGGNRNHVFSMLTACALIVTSALVLPQSAFAEGSSICKESL